MVAEKKRRLQESAKVTSKGQITLPRDVRDDLKLREGDRVSFEKIDGRYVLKIGRASCRERV